MQTEFKKLEKLLSYGIKRKENIFFNNRISCEFINYDDKEWDIYGSISRCKITYSEFDFEFIEFKEIDWWLKRDLNATTKINNERQISKIIEFLLSIFLNSDYLVTKHREKFYLSKIKKNKYFKLSKEYFKRKILKKDIKIYTYIRCEHQTVSHVSWARDTDYNKMILERRVNYIVVINDVIIRDSYLENMLPKSRTERENILKGDLLIRDFAEGTFFEVNKNLTKLVRKKYNFKDHLFYINNEKN